MQDWIKEKLKIELAREKNIEKGRIREIMRINMEINKPYQRNNCHQCNR